MSAWSGKTLGAVDEESARHMADALTYLSRVAIDAGYAAISREILVIRDKMNLIALAEEAARCRAGRA